MSDELEALRARAARNQSLFRTVNERVEELNTDASFSMFICECLDETCTENVPVTLEEYEHIRSVPNRFFVLPGHEVAEVEAVAETSDRFLVVSKLGVGAELAVELDPRADTSLGKLQATTAPDRFVCSRGETSR